MGQRPEVGGGVSIGLIEAVRLAELESEARTLSIFGNTYQPPREFLLLSQTLNRARQARANIVAAVNERIYRECYRNMFVEREMIPSGMTVSFYGTLREWFKGTHPEEFAVAVEKIQALGEEAPYQVLGDPYLHIILPLETEATQEMMIRIGMRAFEEDFGFKPKGFWLPEAAVDNQVLTVLARNGIEYVYLRDSQIEVRSDNPTYVEVEDGGVIRRIAVVTMNTGLSGAVSFRDSETWNVDDFYRRHQVGNISFMTDTEFYGHHCTGKDKFLTAVTNPKIMAENAIVPLNLRTKLEGLAQNPTFTEVVDKSSWSCESGHRLGRWTGDPACACDSSRDLGEKIYKRKLYMTLTALGREIDTRLDMVVPNWRELFVDFFLATRQSMYFSGDIETDVDNLAQNPGFEVLTEREVRKLFFAQLARLTGMTSCFNFFAGNDRVERKIATVNIGEIVSLIPGIETVLPSDEMVWQSIQARLRELGWA